MDKILCNCPHILLPLYKADRSVYFIWEIKYVTNQGGARPIWDLGR